MFKSAINKITTAGSLALAAYEVGSNSKSQPQPPVQVIHEQPIAHENNEHNLELWITLIIIVILLFVIAYKMLFKKRQTAIV